MDLEYSLFADAAAVSSDGRVNLLGGGIDLVKGVIFPAPIHSLFAIARINMTPEEYKNQHDFMVEVFGPDKSKIREDTHYTIMADPNEKKLGKKNWYMLSVHFQGMIFPAPGEYTFVFSVDGNKIGESAIEAVKI